MAHPLKIMVYKYIMNQLHNFVGTVSVDIDSMDKNLFTILLNADSDGTRELEYVKAHPTY